MWFDDVEYTKIRAAPVLECERAARCTGASCTASVRAGNIEAPEGQHTDLFLVANDKKVPTHFFARHIVTAPLPECTALFGPQYKHVFVLQIPRDIHLLFPGLA